MQICIIIYNINIQVELVLIYAEQTDLLTYYPNQLASKFKNYKNEQKS